MKEKAEILSFRNLASWGYLLALALCIIMMNIGVVVTEDLAEGSEVQWPYYLVNEFTGVFLAFALFPLLLWFFERFPLQGRDWWKRLSLYILASMLFGASHTALMYIVRTPVYQVIGLGSYPEFYGILGYRFLMEYFKQLLFFWVAWAAADLLRKIQENQQHRLKAAQLEQQLTQARLQALQMQLNPHFLFNTLNLISSVMYEDPGKADRMMANLSQLLRLTLNASGEEEHTLAEEQRWLGLYMDIMQTRFEDKLEIHWEVSAEAERALAPVFLLQPVLENAIKFSVGQRGKAIVWLRAGVSNSGLEIQVEDNGPGLASNIAGSRGNGLGLANTAERLERLYGENYGLLMENSPKGGASITINIPLRSSPGAPISSL